VYSEACTTLERHGAPRMKGPRDEIIVYNAFDGNDWEHAPMMNAFPTHAAFSMSEPTAMGEEVFTWGEASVTENRNLAGTYTYAEPMQREVLAPGSMARVPTEVPVPLWERYGEPCRRAAILVLEPLVGIVASADPFDCVREPQLTPPRFAAMMVDVTHEYLG